MKAIFGMVSSDADAHRIVNRLLAAGFSNTDISIVYPDRDQKGARYIEGSRIPKKDLAIEKHSKAPEGGVTGAVTGGIVGGSLGLLAGIGALAIPGLGPFIAAGPIMGALSGSAVGGSVGLLLGALIGYGIPEYEAKKYETGLREGKILISVHAETDQGIKRAHEILKKEGATDISVSQEKAGSAY